MTNQAREHPSRGIQQRFNSECFGVNQRCFPCFLTLPTTRTPRSATGSRWLLASLVLRILQRTGCGQPITPYFLTNGATGFESTTITGASWYVLNTAANGLPDASGRVLIMQVTTAGSISGQINYQVFPLGVGADQAQISVEFDGAGTFGLGGGGNACGCTDATAVNYDETAQYDDGSCEFDVPGCTDAAACNFNPEATLDDDSCEFPADNFDCDGNCIADVDCNGVCGGDATEDALGECGGDCAEDADADGICDDVDDCVGELDACGVCNGPGEIFECGCADIPEGDCDCNGNQEDALGVCGGDCTADER